MEGQLEPGKVADLCVLDERLLAGRKDLAFPARELSDRRIDLTVVGGQDAYDAQRADVRRSATAAHGASWATRPNPDGMCTHC